MKKSNTPQRFIAQTLLFIIVVYAIFYTFYGIGFSTVMKNYYIGGFSFIKGFNPYEVTLRNGASDQFKYSPFFALIAGGMSLIPTEWLKLVMIVWQLLSITVFSIGLSCWSHWLSWKPIAVYVTLIACVIDLLTSMYVYQINAIIIGLTLIALAAYREHKFLTAGALLVIAANLKVYPVIFLFGLAIACAPLRFWLGGLVAGLIVLFLPASVVGFLHNFLMHWEWLKVISHDSTGEAVLNLTSAFSRINIAGYNLTPIGQIIQYFVSIVTMLIFTAHAFLTRKDAGEKILWIPWITLGIAALILISPRTEVFTYALLAPCYLLMSEWCAQHIEVIKNRRKTIWFMALVSLMIASCRYTDPTWVHSETPFEIVRVLGALLIWGLAVMLLLLKISGKYTPLKIAATSN
jgi:hypothetical protein